MGNKQKGGAVFVSGPPKEVPRCKNPCRPGESAFLAGQLYHALTISRPS